MAAAAIGGVISGALSAVGNLGSSGIQAQASRDVANTQAQASRDVANTETSAYRDVSNLVNTGLNQRQGIANTAASNFQTQAENYGKEIQQTQNKFSLDSTTKLLGLRDQAYSRAGLPTYLGWSGKDLEEQIPKVIQFAQGNNPYTSKIIGDPMSSNFGNDALQHFYGWGNVISAFQKKI